VLHCDPRFPLPYATTTKTKVPQLDLKSTAQLYALVDSTIFCLTTEVSRALCYCCSWCCVMHVVLCVQLVKVCLIQSFLDHIDLTLRWCFSNVLTYTDVLSLHCFWCAMFPSSAGFIVLEHTSAHDWIVSSAVVLRNTVYASFHFSCTLGWLGPHSGPCYLWEISLLSVVALTVSGNSACWKPSCSGWYAVFYRATAKHTHGLVIDGCPSVRPSVKCVHNNNNSNNTLCWRKMN